MSEPVDADSVLSAIPASIPTIGAGVVGLTHAGVASAAPFLIEGRRCGVEGSGRGTDTHVAFGAWSALSAIDAGLGPAVNLVQTPGLVRRERAGPRGTSTETLLATPTLPLVVVQWTAASGSLPERVYLELDSSAHFDDTNTTGVHPVAIGAGARGIVLRAKDDRVLALACVPAPARIERGPDGEGVVFVLPAEADQGADSVTLIAACGTLAELRAALAAAAHAPAHAVRAAMPADDDGMVLETGVPEIDDGFAWARVRLRGIAARLGVSPARGLAVGLAALAVGDEESVRAALEVLDVHGPERALLSARIASALGDPAAALTAADTVRREAASRRQDAGPANAGKAALFAVAAGALADGLRYAAPDTVISELRRLADTPTPPAAGSEGPAGSSARARSVGRPAPERGVRSLPMAGRPLAPPIPQDVHPELDAEVEARWLARLLKGDPDVAPPPTGDPTTSDLRRAAAAFVSDPDAAWALWRQALAAGIEAGPAGPYSWDARPVSGSRGAGSATAELLLALAHGLLGTAPDAPVGRLRLAPRLPAHVRTFRVRGIPLGEARLTMSYERVGATHRFTLTPEIASVPPLIVFEPAVPGEVVATRVDGVTASLDARPGAPQRGSGGALRTVVPVQFPLDDVRSVEIDVGPSMP